MEISAKKVYKKLQNLGFIKLYHANTVITSCTFLEKRALISRGTMEYLGLPQTPQKSDDADKQFGIWFDIFLDTIDYHDKYDSYNQYGPVLFEIDIEILNSNDNGKIWVTKSNPLYWELGNYKNRWYDDMTDFEDNYKGTHNNHIVFRHSGGMLNLKEYLIQIQLDEPHLKQPKKYIDLYSLAAGALLYSSNKSGHKVKIARRNCSRSGCKCLKYYQSEENLKDILRLFVPKLI